MEWFTVAGPNYVHANFSHYGAGARYVIQTRRRERLAAILVHGASTGLVALPLAVCGLHGDHRRNRAIPLPGR